MDSASFRYDHFLSDTSPICHSSTNLPLDDGNSAEAVAPLTNIRKESDSRLGRDSCYPHLGISSLLKRLIPGEFFEVGHNRFLSHPFGLAILSINHHISDSIQCELKES
jgi:hypothetical protein